MSELDQKVAATTDPKQSRSQAARSALDDQHRYREHIAKGRERLVARMHNHVAALEKFQLAATGLEAARHANGANVKQLEELSQNVTASGEALAEIEMGDAAVAMPATKIVVVDPSPTKAAEPDAESGAMA
jgi:conjugal transfer/entry exclusion protein